MSDGDSAVAGVSHPGHGRLVDVAVVGSLNLDLIARVDRAPGPGETILASEFTERPGGKGLNQAVAAAALVSTALMGAVGDDESGRILRTYAHARGVDVDSVLATDTPTGRALITLLPDGDNTIIVAALANLALTPAAVIEALEERSPRVVLVQFEVTPEVVSQAATWAGTAGARLLVNPSPMRAIAPQVLASADPLLVNAGEANTLADADDTVAELARALSHVARSVVVTDGPAGATIGVQGQITHIPAPVVSSVVDSSGAGDAFAGTLAAELARGASLTEATRAAVTEASRIVSTPRELR